MINNLTTNEIRQKWINFFKSKNHHHQPSSSLVPQNDPSLLWINSGVAALKKYFDGTETPQHNRIVNSQKSLRTNDIENVGISARHHTLFEMLGNFSIGDYFKKDAIKFAFEFLTQELGFKAEKLYITVFKEDKETYDLWIEMGISKNNITKCGKDRNFWEIGEGPSGPCTEIFFDRGEKYDPENIGKKLFVKDIENDRYIEIWNIVFSQFYHDGKGNYSELQRKNIDTGAGLERLASIVQQVPTTFETDYFLPIIRKIEEYTEKKYSEDVYFWKRDMVDDLKKYNEQIKINTSFKIIADHIRASVLAISDGALPSNKDRGYIIRRLIRRSVLNVRKLGIEKPPGGEVVEIVIELMSSYYKDLATKGDEIKRIISDEIHKFWKTIQNGLKMISSYESTIISGKDAFKLFDTYGFPIDLTIEYAKAHKIEVDLNGFYEYFKKHQEISKGKGDKEESSMSKQKTDLLNYFTESVFDYEKEEVSAKVIGCFNENFDKVNEVEEKGWVILDETCLYAESGGQIADSGTINGYEVVDVQKAPNGQHLHKIIGYAQLGENVEVKLDVEKRIEISKNHTTAHLIHEGLDNILGKETKQEGAYYDDKRVRFDYFSSAKIGKEGYKNLEKFVNDKIKESISREIFNTTIEAAKEMGATAQFAEKYGDVVRVVKFGHSIELCGGTHVQNTATIGQFLIQKTETKGAGIYRIEGIVTKERIKSYISDKFVSLIGDYENIKRDYANIKLPSEKVEILLAGFTPTPTPSNYEKQVKSIEELKSEIHILNKKVNQEKSKYAKQELKDDLIKSIQKISEHINLIVHHTTEYDMNLMREVITELKSEYKKICIIALVETDKSNSYIVGVSDDATKQLPARGVLNSLNKISNGRGGGSEQLAQGKAGDIISLCREAMEKAPEIIRRAEWE